MLYVLRMETQQSNSFGTKSLLKVEDQSFDFFSLEALERSGVGPVFKLPFSLKVMLENLLRHEDGESVTCEDIEVLSRLAFRAWVEKEIAFRPARVLMQDFTGIPAIVDLAVMRDVIKQLGGNPKRINPLQPVELVIDHSVQVDYFGTPEAFGRNAELEFQRNRERYTFLKWGQKAFDNFRAVPPDTGIVHQVNLEYLARVVFTEEKNGSRVAYPDTVVGTDSHTTMINGLGVVGWGVGGIEAEAAMLGQPMSMLIPQVVGFKLSGKLPTGTTATDLVLTVTQMLRAKGVVGKFVEFYGPGLKNLTLADRATIANMAPEYGATIGFFPVDEVTLQYLRLTGRDETLVKLIEAYTKAQGLFRTDQTPDPSFSDTLELDLAKAEPSLAGPRRPQDRVSLTQAKSEFQRALTSMLAEPKSPESGVRSQTDPRDSGPRAMVEMDGERFELRHGSVTIAAITSCTNTSNPSVLIGAGLLAKKAVEKGLKVKPWVKTSLAPGSRVVTDYLKEAGLMSYLEALRFHLVGYGCTTCIGNSGPLPQPIADAIQDAKLVVAAILSGNRNFEGRINPLIRANYLASPPLVVAYALAGKIDIDPYNEPLGHNSKGEPVYLREIWPSQEEIQEVTQKTIQAKMFRYVYQEAFQGDERWRDLDAPTSDLFAWDPTSTYVRRPPYFEGITLEVPLLRNISDARVLAVVGDSVTTDHISPAGSIAVDSPAGKYLIEHGVDPKDFNSYGARRGNHEVMMRGTFANIRLRNLMVPGTEGGWTIHLPEGEKMTIYDASMKYQAEGIPLIIIAGKEYGSGSSRDWAAKGPYLLGVRAVIAESFERIHRSNLVGFGILPLQFKDGENREKLGLTGLESYTLEGIIGARGGMPLQPRQMIKVRAKNNDGTEQVFEAIARIDTPIEVAYYRHGGILHYVLRQMIQ
jgi:aconitate hydratase